MDKLQEIKKQVAYASDMVRLLPSEINWLIDTVERQQQEYATLSESIAEDDAIIQQLREENENLHEQLSKVKCKRWYPVYEENLRMAQEIDRLKKAPYDDPCD
jgi:predicted RNase H-like nuclease (RuvC/YqgF family)